MEYIIVTAGSMKQLQEFVNMFIKDNGFKPQGGVCVTNVPLYYQAMIKS